MVKKNAKTELLKALPQSTVKEDWRTPITYIKRFGDAIQALCGGYRPADEMMVSWLDVERDDLRLQEFACKYGPSWAQGIAVIDAAMVLADQPTEGVEHQHR